MTSPLGSLRIGIIGLGNMGGALAAGLLRSGLAPTRLSGFDPSLAALDAFGGQAAAGVGPLAAESDVVVIAVKPHLVAGVAAEVGRAARPGTIVVSVAAGIESRTIDAALSAPLPLVRAMPNIAATVGASATALHSERADGSQRATAQALFETIGQVVWLPRESEMHVFTALASSGPAFVCVFAEALADAAVREGMSRANARAATAAMLEGAARMLRAHAGSPAELKDAVSSPGGTTIVGLCAMEAAGFRAATMAGVEAATSRSRRIAGEA